MMLADIGPNEKDVLVALVTALPAIAAAIFAGRIHAKIKTPSGKSIGKQVEDVNHTVISNNQHLSDIGDKMGTNGATATAETGG